jgi:hypothetical protein
MTSEIVEKKSEGPMLFDFKTYYETTELTHQGKVKKTLSKQID